MSDLAADIIRAITNAMRMMYGYGIAPAALYVSPLADMILCGAMPDAVTYYNDGRREVSINGHTVVLIVDYTIDCDILLRG